MKDYTKIMLGVIGIIGIVVGIIVFVLSIPQPSPAYDFCSNYKPLYEQQCRICENKGGVYVDSPGGLFGGGSTECDFPPKK